MAVQQNKKSPSRRGMRRSHRALAASAVSTDSGGRRHLRHHLSVSPEGGHYRGRQVFESKPPAAAETE